MKVPRFDQIEWRAHFSGGFSTEEKKRRYAEGILSAVPENPTFSRPFEVAGLSSTLDIFDQKLNTYGIEGIFELSCDISIMIHEGGAPLKHHCISHE